MGDKAVLRQDLKAPLRNVGCEETTRTFTVQDMRGSYGKWLLFLCQVRLTAYTSPSIDIGSEDWLSKQYRRV